MSSISRYLNPLFYEEVIYRNLFLMFCYNAEDIAHGEKKKFDELGVSYDKAVQKLNVVFQKRYGRDFDKNIDSVHSLLWSLISLAQPINRILEIGTFEGEGTSVLAELFPQAEIVTVDLPENDPHLRAFYKRDTEEQYKSYLAKQSKNIEAPNIKAIKTNSFFLTSVVTGSFDLIWVDGGHLYPEVAWDICNAWNLCAPGGVVLCDDIVPEKKLYKTPYLSSESYEVLDYLSQRVSTDLKLFLKRRDPRFYPEVLKRKYVAYMKKSL